MVDQRKRLEYREVFYQTLIILPHMAETAFIIAKVHSYHNSEALVLVFSFWQNKFIQKAAFKLLEL